MEYISESKIKAQKWKYFFVLIAWPLYLFLLPLGFYKIGWWSIFFIIFPGLFLFTWVGYLMHESWHKYVPGLPNKLFYYLFASMILTDPQLYHIIHGSHHANVNTYDDAEFYPIGKIKNGILNFIYNFFEIFIGIAFISLVATFSIPVHPKFKTKFSRIKQIYAAATLIVFFGGVGFLSFLILKVPVSIVILSNCIMLYAGSFFLHHSQMIEHGNLIVDGDFKTRNIKTRNLSNKGFFAKIFLFLTHWDSQEHVLHHTLVQHYLRPFRGIVPLPEQSTVITFKDYFKILLDKLSGKESKF